MSGDAYDSIKTTINVYFNLLRAWNPRIDNNYDNLIVGDAYYIDGSGSFTSSSASRQLLQL